MTNLVVLARCATLEEALVVNSLLQDGGFYSHVGEYHISHMQWDVIAAFGGVTVWVRRTELQEAKAYVLDMRRTADERLKAELQDYDDGPLKLRWGRAWSMIFLHLGGAALLWTFIAFLMSLLPIDWWELAAPFQGYGGPFQASSTQSVVSSGPEPGGVLFVLFIALILLWDVIGTMDNIRLKEDASDESENDDPPRAL